MTYPLTASVACFYKLLAGNSGLKPFDHMSEQQKIGISAFAAGAGREIDDVVDEIANQGDDKDRRIARLEGSLLYAESALGSWLADNTEEVFEEQPEIDGIRSTLQEVLEQGAAA